ncbi:hypothetical protein C7M84_007588 [Penaeus vannamei]|uniref:CCHC-type domain-containing protein n=1 Tax=Penaeus vannamei TaxID=6689 RepID=A0A3R7PQI4_PENVA|nr:hypothetical protein C7M84_007588 [Penaeus vannamei]
MIERTNRVVKNALATLLEASPLEWDELLPYVRLAMNSAVHRSVGDQPLYLLTGHIGTYPVGNSNYEETDHEAAQSFAARLRRAREIAVETSVQAREGWARDYNRRTRKSTFAAEVGDLVLFKDLPRMAGAGRRGALGPRWFGPARICKKTGPVTRVEPFLRRVVDGRGNRELLGSSDPWIRWCGLRPTPLVTSLLAPLMLHDPVCSVESGWTGPHARVLRSRQWPFCGLRDYSRAIDDSDDLIRRVFFQGLPRWIREAIVVKEETELCILVETTQRLWSLRESEGSGVSSPAKSLYRPRALEAAEVDPTEKYCRYHKNHEHDSSECRVLSERRQCFACGEQVHFARQCPFVSRQVGRGSDTVTGEQRGAVNH